MDAAYDHIAEKTYAGDRAQTPTPRDNESPIDPATQTQKSQTLQTELQDTFKAFSTTVWGSKLGGLWGTVRKQSETYYEGARREAEAASGEALKGFSDLKETLVQKTRSLSLSEDGKVAPPTAENPSAEGKSEDPDTAIRDNESFLARFRAEAAKRLKDIEKAEDAADEALLRFGTNVRNFLKEAVAVAPPEDEKLPQEEHEHPRVVFDSVEEKDKKISQERRKELLKASTNHPEEEVSWDDDSDNDNAPSTPQTTQPESAVYHRATASTSTLQAPTPSTSTMAVDTDSLKPEGRRSHDEKSVADSDASYDLVSGANSRAPGSPKEDRTKTAGKADDSDEEDWE